MEFREKPMQNLIRIKEKEICKNVQALLLDGESIVGAYKTVRDQAPGRRSSSCPTGRSSTSASRRQASATHCRLRN